MSISTSIRKNSNANIKYRKTSAMFLTAAEPQRRRRKVKSRIVNKSRNVAVLFAEQGLSLSDVAKPVGPQKSDLLQKPVHDNEISTIFLDDGTENRKYSRSTSISIQWKGSKEVEEKQANERDSGSLFFSLKTSPVLGSVRNPLRPSESSINLNVSEQNLRRIDGSNFSEIEASSYFDLDSKLEYSQDGFDNIVCTDDDDELLPPYTQIVPEMFYRFAGISAYSDSNTLQSRGDFEKLLTCLAMENLLEEFLIWFPKPKQIKPGKGYISLNMFGDLFHCKFAQTILEARWQYETLCSAILTMKCLDKLQLNRIEFTQFLQLYRSLYGNDITEKYARSIFKKYDSDGIGLLNIVNIFNFCCDEEDAGD